jgi:tetratricopeptide (TPR) repeat protein
LIESSDAKLSGHEIPATLHDSLMARLDRLGAAKKVLQISAVIGSEFSYELLQAVHPIGDKELQQALHALTDAELLYVRGIAPDATYQFKHALIRDAAYEALLKSRRKDLHRQVAQTVDEQFPALKDTHPEVIARHWTEAGETEPAIAEWSRAAERAEAHNAFKEAEESYRQALALLTLLPDSAERDVRELELRQGVVRILFITRGYSDPQTVQAAEHAVVLAEKTGHVRQLLNLIIARGISAVIGGDLAGARQLADRALKLAHREDSASILGRVHLLQIHAHYFHGDLPGTEKHFDAGLEFFDDPSFRRIRGVAIAAFYYASSTAWMQGRSDIARQRMGRMMAAANDSNPYELAFSERLAAELRASMGDYEQAEALAERALELSEKHRFVELVQNCRYLIGRARAHLGRPAEGVALMRQGIAGAIESGYHVGVAVWTAYLAEAQHRAGAVDNALETVEQALYLIAERTLGRPEIFRIRGELRLARENFQLAEADFRDSIEVARGMGARAWELRTTMSLARLLAHQGRRDEARSVLAEIYNWFTEGFDTADLKDAKALLDELND